MPNNSTGKISFAVTHITDTYETGSTIRPCDLRTTKCSANRRWKSVVKPDSLSPYSGRFCV